MGPIHEHVQRHWEERRQAAAESGQASRGPHGFTIVLTREAGTLGTSVAREVGTRLGWPVYDHELLERIAQEMGLRTSLLESVDEKRVGWMTESMEAFLAVPHVSESAFIRRVIETVLALGAHGECVLVGRGAAHILPAATTLRVRLVAPLHDRVAALSRSLGISLQEAARRIDTTDRERINFIKDHFRCDPTDPHNYDLVLNFARFSTAECAELVVEALRRLQARPRG
jgi:cytidylate kinase